MEAKKISLIGMILGSLIIISSNIVNILYNKSIPTLEEQKSILLFGSSIVIIFSPVYLSIVLDKLSNIFNKKE